MAGEQRGLWRMKARKWEVGAENPGFIAEGTWKRSFLGRICVLSEKEIQLDREPS